MNTERVVKPDEQLAIITDTDQVQTQKPKKIKSTGGIIVDGEYRMRRKVREVLQPAPRRLHYRIHHKGLRNLHSQARLPERYLGNAESRDEFLDRWVQYRMGYRRDQPASDPKSLYEVMSCKYFAENAISCLLANITTALAAYEGCATSRLTQSAATENDIDNKPHRRLQEYRTTYNSIMSRLKSIPGVTSVVHGSNV